LFCTAWEQLLKAEILAAHGEGAVFLPAKQGRRPESITLSKCLRNHL
jgi:hypothetical protein